MRECENCHEFFENENACPHCGHAARGDTRNINLVKLSNVGDQISAEILADRLKQEGVPFIRKYPESGELMRVYAGFSPFGVDFFVAEDDIERARELMDTDIDLEELERQALEAAESANGADSDR